MAPARTRFRLTRKIFRLFVLVAVVPLAAASAAYYGVFTWLSSSVAHQILIDKSSTAALLLDSRRRALERSSASLARETMVTVNIELGLSPPVTAYLREAADEIGADGIVIADPSCAPIAGFAPDGFTLASFAEAGAAAAGGGSADDGGIWASVPVASASGRALGTLYAFIGVNRLLAGLSRDLADPAILVLPDGSAVAASAIGADISGLSARREPPGGGTGPVFASARSGGQNYRIAFMPAETGDRPRWIGAAYSMMRLEMLRDGWTAVLAILLVLIGGLSFAASGYFSRLVTRPLKELASAARGVTASGLCTSGTATAALSIPARGRDDEVGDLARDFDAMARSLAAEVEELEETKSYLEDVVSSLPSALVTVDPRAAVTRMNAAARRLAGIGIAEAVGRPAWEVLPFLAPHAEAILRAAAGGEPRTFPEIRLPGDSRLPGSTRYIEASAFPLSRERGESAVLRIEDITELERKETELRQAQKMEMLGKLATGIAHDFNNVLMGIMGTASLLALKLEEDPPPPASELAADAKSILSIGERAKELVRQIARLSRKQELSLSEIDLRSSIRSVMAICSRSFDKSIELSVSLPDRPAPAEADPVLVEQVVLNVCVNAAHAMTIMRPADEKPGGRLSMSLEPIRADARFLREHPLAREGLYWAIRVSDTGVGMDEATMQRIFDPFFTTKEQGQGTGMGLATAYGIVRRHGGLMDARSEPGSGTTFTIYFRALESAFLPEGEEEEEAPLRGSGRVVILDDEENVRSVTAGMLSAIGYEAVGAATVEEAAEALAASPPGEAMAIIDMSMPAVAGDEAFRILKRARPDLRAVIASGYRADPRIDTALREGALEFLQKPYSILDLSRCIGRMAAREAKAP